MKKILYAAALGVASLGVSACASFDVSNPVLEGTVVDEKAMFIAETAFKGAGEAIEAGVDEGLIVGETAATVQGYYASARAALLAARQAQQAGDSGTLLEQAALVQEYVSKIFGAL